MKIVPVLISLLRGINVGGNKKIKMAELRALYEALGFTGAQTLLQSGNVVFESETSDVEHVASQIEAGIEQRFGFQSTIIMRTREQLREIIQRNPFSAEQLAEPRKLLVMFLQTAPDAEAVEALIESYNGPEGIHLQGQELYIYYTDGMGRSKLNNAFIERKLKTAGTGRNWNTVNKLFALAETL